MFCSLWRNPHKVDDVQHSAGIDWVQRMVGVDHPQQVIEINDFLLGTIAGGAADCSSGPPSCADGSQGCLSQMYYTWRLMSRDEQDIDDMFEFGNLDILSLF